LKNTISIVQVSANTNGLRRQISLSYWFAALRVAPSAMDRWNHRRMLFAVAFYRRGRICDAVLAHSSANAMLAINVLATDQW